MDEMEEKELAFWYGVDVFCKEAGFDAEDRDAMYRLIKSAMGPGVLGQGWQENAALDIPGPVNFNKTPGDGSFGQGVRDWSKSFSDWWSGANKLSPKLYNEYAAQQGNERINADLQRQQDVIKKPYGDKPIPSDAQKDIDKLEGLKKTIGPQTSNDKAIEQRNKLRAMTPEQRQEHYGEQREEADFDATQNFEQSLYGRGNTPDVALRSVPRHRRDYVRQQYADKVKFSTPSSTGGLDMVSAGLGRQPSEQQSSAPTGVPGAQGAAGTTGSLTPPSPDQLQQLSNRTTSGGVIPPITPSRQSMRFLGVEGMNPEQVSSLNEEAGQGNLGLGNVQADMSFMRKNPVTSPQTAAPQTGYGENTSAYLNKNTGKTEYKSLPTQPNPAVEAAEKTKDQV
jgi:hypothetical protein